MHRLVPAPLRTAQQRFDNAPVSSAPISGVLFAIGLQAPRFSPKISQKARYNKIILHYILYHIILYYIILSQSFVLNPLYELLKLNTRLLFHLAGLAWTSNKTCPIKCVMNKLPFDRFKVKVSLHKNIMSAQTNLC